jgi:hypothetical protein
MIELWPYIVAGLGAIAAIVTAYVTGRRDASQRADLRDATEYQEAMKEAANAPVHTDPDAARQRMRNRAKKRDL